MHTLACKAKLGVRPWAGQVPQEQGRKMKAPQVESGVLTAFWGGNATAHTSCLGRSLHLALMTTLIPLPATVVIEKS